MADSTVSVSAYTPITTSGQIHYTGLGNGTDFDTLISQLVQVEQSRITSLQTWRKSWTDKQAAFQVLNTKLLSLKTTLDGMDSMGEFMVKSTDSSDSSVVAATAGAETENGTHVLQVNRIATAKSMATTTGYSSASANINTSGAEVSFNYVYKGVIYSNAVGAGASLTDLANIINNSPSNPGVKASIVYDGSKYFLQVRGMDTGAGASLTIASNSSLIGFKNSDFNVISSNASAQLKVDGWPTGAGQWITRESNSVSDLISGMTLKLKDTGTVTLTTTTNTDAIKENIQTFVSQINEVRAQLKELTKVDTTTQSGSILTGNYGLQIIGTQLADIVAGRGVGFDTTRDKYSVLSQLGITTDATEGSATEGLLVIDNDTLDALLSSNADAVGQLFAAQNLGGTDSTSFSLTSYVTNLTKPGTYDISYTTDASGKITAATINGHPAIFHSNSNMITGSAGYPESGMVIKAIDLSPSATITGKAYLKQGKAGELSDTLATLTSNTDGPLHILDENYTDITNMIDDKIAFEQRRISLYEQNLRYRFSKLDALLGTYNQMSQQLTSQIEQLSTSSS